MKSKRRKHHSYTKPLPYKKTNLHFTCLDLFSGQFLTGIQLFDFHFHSHFWAAICKTVRPMLSDPCLSCLSVLSVTLVYCAQTVGWIKMKIGKQIGLSTGHIVLDGDPAPLPQKGALLPIFGPYLLWPNGWMDQDETWHAGRPQRWPQCVRWVPSSTPERGQSPQSLAHICCGQMAGWIKM